MGNAKTNDHLFHPSHGKHKKHQLSHLYEPALL